MNEFHKKEKPIAASNIDTFRTLGSADSIPNDFVVPFYLEDLKRRISIARVDQHFYAFDDLCRCAEEACPLSAVCSPARRLCVNATVRVSTSQREP